MQDLRKALDRMEPPRAEAGDWEAVLRDADARPTRRFLRPLAAVAAAAAALFALALFQPWDGENPTVLERALAAVGDGPVLHVVLRGEWGGTLVDLETGSRQPVHGENEIWYDTERGLVHSRSLLGGVVQYEEVYDPKEPPAELVALGTEYRQALEDGSARVAGQGVVEGEPVYWITFHSEMLPDSSDGKLHEWAQQVAVSRESFEPVATRETRDGEPGPGTRQRVLLLETLRSGEGDFTASEANSLEGTMFKESREALALGQARDVLGRAPLWLGREYRGLPLVEVWRKATAIGRQERIRLTGELARKAEKCSELRGREGGRCLRELGYRGSLEIRPDGVYTHGSATWEEERTAVVLFYGALGDEPSTFRRDLVPRYDAPHVAVTETTERIPFERGAGRYVPPEGSLFLAAGGTGFLRSGDLHVAIDASSEELILSAARALEPMPR
jgi:hypothetical protein